MKWEHPYRILKTVKNEDLPLLSNQELHILDVDNESPNPTPATPDSHTRITINEHFNVSAFSLAPSSQSNISKSCLEPETNNGIVVENQPSTPVSVPVSTADPSYPKNLSNPSQLRHKLKPIENVFKIPKTPKNTKLFAARQMCNFAKDVPQVMSTPKSFLPMTPAMHRTTPHTSGIPCTPNIFNLCSASPCLGNFSMDILSTPALFPKISDLGVPDILSMIDNDEQPAASLTRRVDTFDAQSLCDENIIDYLLDVSEDYTKITTPKKQRNSSVIVVESSREIFHKGCRGKRVSAELDRILRDERQLKYKERRKEKKNKLKMKKDEIPESAVDTITRKVRRCGRRTRSLIRACKEIGLANSDADIDAIFMIPESKQDEDDE